MLPGGDEGQGSIQKARRAAAGRFKAQTCDCCLYLEEQKGIDVVKGRRQSWSKYSVASYSGCDSAHCGGPAWDVSDKGMRLPFCKLGNNLYELTISSINI